MKRTMRPSMRLGLALGRGWLRRLLPLRRRNAGIVGRLRRQAQLRLKFGDPRHERRVLRDKRLDPRDQCGDQGVFLGQIRRRSHPKVDSYSRCRRNQKKTVPNTGPSSHHQGGVSNCNQIRHFIAVVEAGSFTKGAQHAAVSQSAISTSIAKIEAELDVKLLDRRLSPLGLTPAGKRLLEHFHDA